jgi:hypothetical protein
MKNISVFMLAVVLGLAAGCDTGPQSAKGFRLPDGDLEQGKTAFVELKCNTCHSVSGVELPPADSPGPVQLQLGGEVHRVKTYGELVTAIIYPSHNLSEKFQKELIKEGTLSPMGDFNHVMTVQQLIDLVAFLQPQYELEVPEYVPYP